MVLHCHCTFPISNMYPYIFMRFPSKKVIHSKNMDGVEYMQTFTSFQHLLSSWDRWVIWATVNYPNCFITTMTSASVGVHKLFAKSFWSQVKRASPNVDREVPKSNPLPSSSVFNFLLDGPESLWRKSPTYKKTCFPLRLPFSDRYFEFLMLCKSISFDMFTTTMKRRGYRTNQ